jgi:tetratricopeptide (TPR) repeat protein
MSQGAGRPVRLEGFTPLHRSLEARISRQYWESRGHQAFLQREVPSDITNDGVRADQAAAVLFENCIEADNAGSLGEAIDVLEIGVGTGLFARILLRRFGALCAQHGREFDRRLRYFATDVSLPALTTLHHSGMLDGMRHSTCLATLDACEPATFIPFDDAGRRGWDQPLQAVFHNYLYDVLPQTLLLQQNGWLELRVQTWLGDAARLAETTGYSLEDIQRGLADSSEQAVAALAAGYRLIEVERGFFPVSIEDVPYGELVPRFVASLQPDSAADVRLWLPFGAMRSLEQTAALLAPGGFLLFTDYGAATPAEMVTARAYQRYGAGVCIPLNFPLIGWYAQHLGLRHAAPADDDLPLHARLITRRALPHTERCFLDRFDMETFRTLEQFVADARALAAQNVPASRASFRKAVDLSPNNWLVQAEWAHMETEAGDPQTGLQIANRAIEINPCCSADVWCEKGDALHRFGDYDGAVGAYRMALRINASHSRSHHDLAGLFTERGGHADALKALGEAFAGDVDGRHTKVLIEKQAAILDARAAEIQSDLDRVKLRHYG